MDRVPLDTLRKLLSYGPLSRIGGGGSGHHLSPLCDRIFPLEGHHHHGPFSHEPDQTSVKRAGLVDLVECLGLRLSEANHFQAADGETSFADLREYSANVPGRDCVRLDDS